MSKSILYRLCSFPIFALVLTFSLPTSPHAQPSYPVTLTDATGEQVTITHPPSRIVSLIPSNTEMLFSLGLEDAIVGVTAYCNYPPEAKQKPSIGDLMTFSVEHIVASKPDLILATKDNPYGVIQGLKNLGLTIFVLDPQTVNDVIEALRMVGRLTGRRVLADSLAGSLRSRINAVTEKLVPIPLEQRPTVFLGNPKNSSHWTPGPGTFTTSIISLAGGRNIADDLTPQAWGVYSLEQLLAKNPDVILTTGFADSSSEEPGQEIIKFAGALPGWREIRAIQTRRVYIVSEDWLMRPGPRVALAVEQIARYLFPDVFTEE